MTKTKCVHKIGVPRINVQEQIEVYWRLQNNPKSEGLVLQCSWGKLVNWYTVLYIAPDHVLTDWLALPPELQLNIKPAIY